MKIVRIPGRTLWEVEPWPESREIASETRRFAYREIRQCIDQCRIDLPN